MYGCVCLDVAQTMYIMRASLTVCHQELDLLCQIESLYLLFSIFRLVPDNQHICVQVDTQKGESYYDSAQPVTV